MRNIAIVDKENRQQVDSVREGGSVRKCLPWRSEDTVELEPMSRKPGIGVCALNPVQGRR